MKNNLSQSTLYKETTMQKIDKERLITPHIIIKSEVKFQDFAGIECPTIKTYDQIYKDQKIIPGYNFQSLFRKKSQIRLARKKNKEEAEKKQNVKHDHYQREMKNIMKGHWTVEQNKRYHWFLQLHNKHFIYKYLRRTDKIFKSMANFIKTREAEQCRSHHQKMQKKYNNFYQILLKLRQQFYESANPELLKIQLQQNDLQIKQVFFISEYELKHGKFQNDFINENDLMVNTKINELNNNEQEEDSCSEDNNNILDEDYSKQLKFHTTY